MVSNNIACLSIFTSYTSPDDGGNDVEDDPTPTSTRAIEKLKDIVDQLEAAINGDEIINVISGDGSASGESGSGESGDGGNVIPEITDEPPTSENDIDENEDDENVQGGGVGQPKAGLKKNSASRHVMGAWLLCSAIWVLRFALIA